MRSIARLGALGLALAVPALARAQSGALSGYAQNVLTGNGASALLPSAATDAARLRLMATLRRGAFNVDVASEQFFRWQSAEQAGSFGGLSSARATLDWLPLDGTLASGARAEWRHRLDRLAVAWSGGPITVTVGRQAISWATTLFLSPADPFVPFDPADPFREFRTGVDAARVQWFAGPFTEVELVGRLTDETRTLLGRARTSLAGWDLALWGGALHDEPAGAIGVTRTVAGAAIRGEAALRRTEKGGAALRAAIGFDRRFDLFGRDLYVVAEYQHDELGAAMADQLSAVSVSGPARLGELQAFGREEAMTRLTWQAHPLVSVEWLALVNLRDGSALVAPAVEVSISEALTLRAGGFAGTGAGSGGGSRRSEYGDVPALGYGALSVYF